MLSITCPTLGWRCKKCRGSSPTMARSSSAWTSGETPRPTSRPYSRWTASELCSGNASRWSPSPMTVVRTAPVGRGTSEFWHGRSPRRVGPSTRRRSFGRTKRASRRLETGLQTQAKALDRHAGGRLVQPGVDDPGSAGGAAPGRGAIGAWPGDWRPAQPTLDHPTIHERGGGRSPSGYTGTVALSQIGRPDPRRTHSPDLRVQRLDALCGDTGMSSRGIAGPYRL